MLKYSSSVKTAWKFLTWYNSSENTVVIKTTAKAIKKKKKRLSMKLYVMKLDAEKSLWPSINSIDASVSRFKNWEAAQKQKEARKEEESDGVDRLINSSVDSCQMASQTECNYLFCVFINHGRCTLIKHLWKTQSAAVGCEDFLSAVSWRRSKDTFDRS